MTEETVVNDNLIGSEDAVDTSWQSRYLSDDLRENDTLGKFEDVGSLGKSYLELQKMVGSRIKVPTDESSEDEVNDFYSKVGRPDSPDKYTINLPEGADYDNELVGQFYEVAYKNGLSNKQAQSAIEFYNHINADMSINHESQMQQSRVDSETSLKKEWGLADYNKNLALSKKAFKRFADDDLKEFVDKTGMSNNVAMIKFLYKIGNAFSDPDMGGLGKDSANVDSDSAKLEINAIMKDSKHKYNAALFDGGDPKHKEAVAYRDHLYEIAYPGEDDI
jgi:hypothetical protein